MDKKEKLRIADVAIRKNMDYETLYWSDDMYGRMDKTDEVWEYVMECREIGEAAFYEKYDI